VSGNFFSSVFTVKEELSSSSISLKPSYSPVEQLIFSEQFILDKLNKINITKSPWPDGIHPRVLYELLRELLWPLNTLFDSSYKLGKLLDEWKIGHLTAVYKKGNKSDLSSYRPISSTSVICSLMKYIIRDHVIWNSSLWIPTLVINSIALLKVDLLSYNWTAQLDSVGQVDVIYSHTDFAKAFDTVPHHRLLLKLKT